MRVRLLPSSKPVVFAASHYAAADVVHWHGAAPGQTLVQINVGFGGASKWFEDVSDAEYQGKK